MSEVRVSLKVIADARGAIQAFADSKRSLSGLQEAARKATADVAATARALKARPGDVGLAKEFERLKLRAGAAKQEFQRAQAGTETLRRSLHAQGVDVSRLSESWGRLRASMAAAQAQAKSSLTSQISPSSAKGPMPTSRNVSNIVQDGAGVLSGMESSVDRLTQKVGLMGRIAAGVFAAQALLPYLATLGRVSDAYINLNTQLQLATRESGSFAQAKDDVVRIASAAQAGISETAALYARLTGSITRLGFAQSEVAKVTEVVALSLRVSGATAAESSSAILQLSQAFGSGVLRGEEFNAVNEASPRLMQALADAMGRPREELRSMAEQGQLTSRVLALALPQALADLQAEAASMPLTIGGAFTELSNEFTLFVGRINDGTSVFSVFAQTVSALAKNLETVIGALSAAFAAYVARKLAGIAAIAIAQARQTQAAVTGLAAQTAAQTGLATATAATAAATTAAAATATTAIARVTTAMGVALRLLTGPVGLAVSVGIAAAAWLGFRSNATQALDEVIARQRELNRLKGATPTERAVATDQRTARLDEAEAQIDVKKKRLDRAETALRSAQLRRLTGPRMSAIVERHQAALAEYQEAREALAAERAALQKNIEDSAKADAEREAALAKALQEATNVAAGAAAARTGAGGGQAGREQTERKRAEQERLAAAQALTKARLELEENIAAQADRLADDATQRAMAAARAEFEARRMSAEAYYARLATLQEEMAAREIAAIERQRNAAAAMAGDPATGETERLKAIGEVNRLNTDIALAQTRLADLKTATVAALAQAQQQAIREEFNALQAQWQQTTERMRTAQQAIQIQQQAGLLTEAQARQQIVTLQQQAASELERLLPLLEQSAQAIGPDAVNRVQAWKNELAGVRLVVDDVAVAVDGAVQDGFARMFESIATGARTAKEAFADFARSVISAIVRIQAQRLAESLFGSVAGGGGGSVGGFVSRFLRRARGGYVSGPGTGTSDSIPAWLSNGEYVVRASAVRHFGAGFFDRVNRFAEGGLVGQRAAGGAAALGGVNITINNTQAQQVEARATTRSGTRDGAMSVQIDIVDAALAKNIKQGRGQIFGALRSMGLNPALGAV